MIKVSSTQSLELYQMLGQGSGEMTLKGPWLWFMDGYLHRDTALCNA